MTQPRSDSFTDSVTLKKVTVGSVDLTSSKLGYDVAVIGDIHLGHARVRTQTIIQMLDRTFSDNDLNHLDLIVINGDLFDKRLPMDSDDAHSIIRWMRRFILACKKNNTSLMVLEGTPSHDNKQSNWFVLMAEFLGVVDTVRYINKLAIEPLYPNGPYALLVPDEVNHDASDTWLQVMELMRSKGLESVDYAFMHGMFRYQEPILSVVSHNEENYHKIVSQRIVINHHHTHTTCGRIVAPGSPERLRHNEEEDKGHYRFTIVDGSACNDTMVVNDKASIFSTIDVCGMSFADVVNAVNNTNYLPGSQVRLKLSRSDPAYVGMKSLKNHFPHYYLSTKVVEAETYTSDSDDLIDRPTIVAIRPETIGDLLMPRLSKAGPDVLSAVSRILSEG